MPILTQAQLDALLATYASGISEIDIPGDKRIRYADPEQLRKILTEAGTEEPQAGSFRTYAEFHRNR